MNLKIIWSQIDIEHKNKLDNRFFPFQFITKQVITFGTNYLNMGRHIAFRPRILQCNMHKYEKWSIHEVYTLHWIIEHTTFPHTHYLMMAYEQYSNNNNETHAWPQTTQVEVDNACNTNFHFCKFPVKNLWQTQN